MYKLIDHFLVGRGFFMKKTKFLALLMSATLALGVMPAYAQTSEQTSEQTAEGEQLVLEQEIVIEKESSDMSYTFENGIFSMVDGEYSITLSNVTAVKERALSFYGADELDETLRGKIVVYCSDETKILDKSYELDDEGYAANPWSCGFNEHLLAEDIDVLYWVGAQENPWGMAILYDDFELDDLTKLSKAQGPKEWLADMLEGALDYTGEYAYCASFAYNILLTSDVNLLDNSTSTPTTPDPTPEVSPETTPEATPEPTPEPTPTTPSTSTTDSNIKYSNPKEKLWSDSVYVTSLYEQMGLIALNNYGSASLHTALTSYNKEVFNTTNWSLKQGMELYLPETLSGVSRLDTISGTIYTVKSGDTLGAISKAYYGTSAKYMDIFNANSDRLKNANSIYVGQQLVIPNA